MTPLFSPKVGLGCQDANESSVEQADSGGDSDSVVYMVLRRATVFCVFPPCHVRICYFTDTNLHVPIFATGCLIVVLPP